MDLLQVKFSGGLIFHGEMCEGMSEWILSGWKSQARLQISMCSITTCTILVNTYNHTQTEREISTGYISARARSRNTVDCGNISVMLGTKRKYVHSINDSYRYITKSVIFNL